MIKIFLIITVFGFNLISSLAQEDTSNVIIKYYDATVKVTSSSDKFFSGRLEISKGANKVYEMDSIFTNYAEHRLIDLNGDGSDELLLSLTEGASPYVFHNLYIFDITRGYKPLYVILNGDVDTANIRQPKIIFNERVSPAILGLWISWPLVYRNKELVFSKPNSSQEKARYRPDEESISENLKELRTGTESCKDYNYAIFFETIFISYWITGEKNKAFAFFNKHFKCPDKEKVLEQMQNAAEDTYSWINDEANYKYADQ